MQQTDTRIELVTAKNPSARKNTVSVLTQVWRVLRPAIALTVAIKRAAKDGPKTEVTKIQISNQGVTD